jgi:NAD(P)-dependent dehydrogenase (short-subunit alcohol dehydrogenase family)
MTIAGDITSGAFIKELVEKSGKLDGMVHSAGLAPMCPIGMLAADESETVMRTNYYSFLEMMKYYSKNKYHGNSMSVVAVSSVSSRCGWAGGSIYCGSKGALSASVRALSVELAPRGVRVNAVCPSNVRTPLYESGAGEMNDENAIMELIKKQPLGLGEPEQIAWPICFLLSDAASFITGIELPVDGGYLAK